MTDKKTKKWRLWKCLCFVTRRWLISWYNGADKNIMMKFNSYSIEYNKTFLIANSYLHCSKTSIDEGIYHSG